MDTASVKSDLAAIVAAETSSGEIAPLDSSSRLSELGCNVDSLLDRLGLTDYGANGSDQMSVDELISLIEAQPVEVRDKLVELATGKRIQRLLQGIILATSAEAPADEAKRWWYGLATQILWWYARHCPKIGLDLVKRSAPARATQNLADLGLLDIQTLSYEDASSAATFLDILERLGYPDEVALRAYQALAGVAKQILSHHDGQLQRSLRDQANLMLDQLADELLSGCDDREFVSQAVRSWISATTGLPIIVWSPSANDFVEKFGELGASTEMLVQVADELGIGLQLADNRLAQFMEEMCRACDPDDAGHQFCVKRFAMMNWQVECPGRADSAK
jgi:hypothetical protein